MKPLIVPLLLVSAVLIAGCTSAGTPPAGNATPANQGAYGVAAENFAFSPADLEIKAGESVTWTNKDAVPHTIASDSGTEINSSSLSGGQAYSHTFGSTGIFGYHCSIHPYMKGRITVV